MYIITSERPSLFRQHLIFVNIFIPLLTLLYLLLMVMSWLIYRKTQNRFFFWFAIAQLFLVISWLRVFVREALILLSGFSKKTFGPLDMFLLSGWLPFFLRIFYLALLIMALNSWTKRDYSYSQSPKEE